MNGANNEPINMQIALHQIVDTCVRSGVVDALPGMIGIYLDVLEQKQEQKQPEIKQFTNVLHPFMLDAAAINHFVESIKMADQMKDGI